MILSSKASGGSQRSAHRITCGLVAALLGLVVLLHAAPGRLDAQSTATLRLELDATTLALGQTYKVYITVENASAVMGVDIDGTFDATTFDVVVANPGQPIQSLDLIKAEQVDANTVNNAAGTFRWRIRQIFPSPPFSGSGRIAVFQIRPKRLNAATPLALSAVALKNEAGADLPAVSSPIMLAVAVTGQGSSATTPSPVSNAAATLTVPTPTATPTPPTASPTRGPLTTPSVAVVASATATRGASSTAGPTLTPTPTITGTSVRPAPATQTPLPGASARGSAPAPTDRLPAGTSTPDTQAPLATAAIGGDTPVAATPVTTGTPDASGLGLALVIVGAAGWWAFSREGRSKRTHP
ncbi:MAG: hypothetical protein K1X39_11510 [Thermoflexales bacterium]|nr:hypothetical protein [Thermoflexales bacterium]